MRREGHEGIRNSAESRIVSVINAQRDQGELHNAACAEMLAEIDIILAALGLEESGALRSAGSPRAVSETLSSVHKKMRSVFAKIEAEPGALDALRGAAEGVAEQRRGLMPFPPDRIAPSPLDGGNDSDERDYRGDESFRWALIFVHDVIESAVNAHAEPAKDTPGRPPAPLTIAIRRLAGVGEKFSGLRQTVNTDPYTDGYGGRGLDYLVACFDLYNVVADSRGKPRLSVGPEALKKALRSGRRPTSSCPNRGDSID